MSDILSDIYNRLQQMPGFDGLLSFTLCKLHCFLQCFLRFNRIIVCIHNQMLLSVMRRYKTYTDSFPERLQ